MRHKIHLFFACITIAGMTSVMAQDVAGEYKMNGLYVVYHDIIRATTDLVVNDIYGIGIAVPISTMPEGYVFYHTYNGPHSEAALTASGINLNVNFGEDGIAEIVEGSFYPDVNEENCITSVQVLPITDVMEYSSDLTAGFTIPSIDIIGYPTESNYGGMIGGSISLSTGFVLDYFPSTPTNVQLPSTYFIDLDGDGNMDIYVPAGTDLPGVAGGFILKEPGLVSMSSTNQAVGVYPDMYFEWHAVDGPVSESGLGDIIGEDEDGITGDYDRIFGLPYITATHMNPACGFNYAIAGDVSGIFEDLGLGYCVDAVSVANDVYLMDAQFATWGNFLTYNGVVFGATIEGCMMGGGTYDDCLAYIIATNPGLLSDDSDHDFDGTSGRIVMNFAPTCLPEYESRLVMVEMRDLLGGCSHSGDINLSGSLDVADIVLLVSEILGNNPIDLTSDQFCEADMNADLNLTVLDIVMMVQAILNPTRADNATSIEIAPSGHTATFTSDGFVGGIELTLSHGAGFVLNLTDNALVADYKTEGTMTHIIIVAPEGNDLFTTNGEFIIESALAATGSEYLNMNLVSPSEFSLSTAYPNPFNPVTNMSLSLDSSGNVTVQIFNLQGQLIETLMSGYQEAGVYDIRWNASEAPSGMYFVKSTFNSEVLTQKLVLLKQYKTRLTDHKGGGNVFSASFFLLILISNSQILLTQLLSTVI